MEYREKYNKVDHLVDKLHAASSSSSSLKDRRNVLEFVRRHLSHTPSDSVRLIECGALKPLLDLLNALLPEEKQPAAPEKSGQHDPTEANQVVSVSISLLLQLSTAKSDAADLQKETSLRTILTLMGKNNSQSVRSRACRCLGNILQTINTSLAQDCIRKISTEVTKSIVDMFDPADLQEVALRTVRQSVTCTTLKRPLLRSALFTSALIPLLANSDSPPAILQHTLMCLSTFVVDTLEADISAETVSRHLGPQLRRIVQLAGDETPGVQQSAIDLLCRLASNAALRNQLGSKGVISCFIEHLSFDDQQTTVSSVQKKIVYALTLCCRDGFNRARLSDIGGVKVLMAVLGSSLYRPVHLHILNCLTEFRHDEVTLGLMVMAYGAVGHAARYLSAALEVLSPKPAGSSDVARLPGQGDDAVKVERIVDLSSVTPGSLSTSPSTSAGPSSPLKTATTPRRFSCRSPSYQNVLQESESRRQESFCSPEFSPPTIDDELRRDLQSNSCLSPLSTTSSSPSSPQSPPFTQRHHFDGSGYSGRYSPVVTPEEREATTVDAAQLSFDSSDMDVSTALLPVKDSSNKTAVPDRMPAGSSSGSKRKLDSDMETDDMIVKRPCLPVEVRPFLSMDDARKCLQYVVSFFEAVSYRQKLVPYLATSNVIFGLVRYIEDMPRSGKQTETSSPDVKAVFHTLLRIVKEPNCFEALVKIGLPLVLQDNSLEKRNAAAVKAKQEALAHLRVHAAGEFGFGEVLHLGLCSNRQIRMNCIACAAVLIHNRADRVRFFKKNQVLEQLMEALVDLSSGLEHCRMVTQALNAFFSEEIMVEEIKTFPGVSDGAAKPESCCLTEETGSKMEVDDDEGVFLLDDGVQVTASRRLLTARSEVFAAMLGNSFREGQAPVIPIRNTPTPAFCALVHFFSGCHLDSCPELHTVFQSADDTLDLVQLADQFLAFDLRDFACDCLVEKRMDGVNAGRIFETSHCMQLDFVGEKMLERVLKGQDMPLSLRSAVLDSILRSECALVAVNYIRVLLETAM